MSVDRAIAPGVVSRRRLGDRLAATPLGGVAVVWAPAGSGKTTLLRSWTAECEEPVAWVSVERGERDAQRFWVALVGEVAGAAGEDGPVEPVGSSPGFAGEAIVTRLLAGVRALDRPLLIVIDDLHELASAEALGLLELFVAHLPPTVRLVIATREDPKLGLHRLRVRGLVTELGGADLSFRTEETRELLAGSGVEVSDESLALLDERTEGWAAGLRLAALSLSGHPDPDRFVREFTGSERTVAAYLMAEVLERQPPAVRDLLLRTSILDKVSGPLADRLTGTTGSEAVLQRLADANAFVTPLDAGRTWFRYHHLFADLLRLELRRVAPGAVVELHCTAARWFEQEGDVVAAIGHAQAARDWPYAARVVSERYIALILDGRAGAVQALLEGFPPELPARDPQLALVAAAARIPDAALEEGVRYLEVADAARGEVPPARATAFDLELGVVKLAQARRRGDLPAVLEAMNAVDAALHRQPLGPTLLAGDLHALALMDLGIAETWAARFDDARRHLEQALGLVRRAEWPYLEVACLGHLGLADLLSGESLAEALGRAEEAEAVAGARGFGEDPVVATACAVVARVRALQGHFADAERALDRAERVVRAEGEPATDLIIHQTRGEVRLAEARLEDALRAFRAAERVHERLVDAHLLSVDPRLGLALAHVRQGDVAAARSVLDDVPRPDRDHLTGRVVDAAIAMVEDEPEQALDLLAPLLEHDGGGPRSPRVRALLLLALASDAVGDRRRAEEGLERALDVAEPDGIVLPFLVLPLRDLLERHRRHRSAHATLLSEILDAGTGHEPPGRAAVRELDEPLSEAELRVVRYLPTNLKSSEIAAELFVSNNTVRTHVSHIYRKLGAHSRGEAVARARELGLLGPSSRLG